jgi:RNA-directed DNA polymerase
VEFGCYAAVNRQRRGQGKPETFAFLGFTHICGKTRSGRFTVLRQTIRQRLQAKLGEVKTELMRHAPTHSGVGQVAGRGGSWSHAVLWCPHERAALFLLRSQVGWLSYHALSRRSQNGHVDWDRMRRLIDRWLPPLRIYHPYPLHRFFGVST